MTIKVLPALKAANRQLISRSQFLASAVEPSIVSADDSLMKASIELHERVLVRREVGPHTGGHPIRCLERFDGLQIQQMNEADSEAVQMLMSQEGEKLYAFDRMVRVFTVNGFLYDTDKDLVLDGTKVKGRHGLREWKEFYERARLSQVVKNNQVVVITVMDQIYRGAFVSSSMSNSSSDPHKMELVAQFLCETVRYQHRAGPATLRNIPGTDVRGRLTVEGAASVGLLPQLQVDHTADKLFVSRLPSVETVVGVVVQPKKAVESLQGDATVTRPRGDS